MFRPHILELLAQSGFDTTPDVRAKIDQFEQLYSLVAAEAVAVVQRRYQGDNNREDAELQKCLEDLRAHFDLEKARYE
jgi:hypothetical protein